MQFQHKNGKGKDSDGLGLLANQIVKGLPINGFVESQSEAGHGISTFVSEIMNLPTGTYKWDGNSWICENCK